MLKLKVLKWRYDSGDPGGPHIITRILLRGRQEVRVGKGDVAVEAEVGVMWPPAKECRWFLEVGTDEE